MQYRIAAVVVQACCRWKGSCGGAAQKPQLPAARTGPSLRPMLTKQARVVQVGGPDPNSFLHSSPIAELGVVATLGAVVLDPSLRMRVFLHSSLGAKRADKVAIWKILEQQPGSEPQLCRQQVIESQG